MGAGMRRWARGGPTLGDADDAGAQVGAVRADARRRGRRWSFGCAVRGRPTPTARSGAARPEERARRGVSGYFLLAS
jgi:hypothetical protein